LHSDEFLDSVDTVIQNKIQKNNCDKNNR